MNGEVPIEQNEFVLRRIHRNNVTRGTGVAVKRCEFEPKPQDIDGVSLFRERYTSVETLLAAARSPNDCYVARFCVRDLAAFGFHLQISPGPLPGHVGIVELTYEAFQQDRHASKDLQVTLAERASERICHQPPGV